jgi:hypothetical protein
MAPSITTLALFAPGSCRLRSQARQGRDRRNGRDLLLSASIDQQSTL